MEWTTCIKETLKYIEEHLLDSIGVERIAKEVHISSIYLQKGFQILTGYTIGEYIRNRRLYEAGKELISSDKKIIDIAYQYGYETPESFSKAFFRFHNATPLNLRKNPKLLKFFHPIQIEIIIKGGNVMDYVVEKMPSFKVIGFARDFSFENSYMEIPKFWDEIYQKYNSKLYAGENAFTTPANALECAILENKIGEYGICLGEVTDQKKFKYLIAGKYQGGNIPEGLEVFEFPSILWAKFKCVGPMPTALQEVNTRIYKEWLPGNKEYEIDGTYDIEWYSSEGDMNSSTYVSEIWIPVKKK